MHAIAKRGFWIFMALLFVVTGVGVGVYAFWINTHPSAQSNVISCARGNGKQPNQQPGSDGKIDGAKLADYKPPQKFSYESCADYIVGTGAAVNSTSATVTVQYVGALASDGTIFDNSFDRNQPLSIALNQVIQGWSDGLQGMKVGGFRRLFIPSQYGYGSYTQTGIPANSDLVFDVQLLAVK